MCFLTYVNSLLLKQRGDEKGWCDDVEGMGTNAAGNGAGTRRSNAGGREMFGWRVGMEIKGRPCVTLFPNTGYTHTSDKPM